MACHAGGRGFESRPLCQHYLFINASFYIEHLNLNPYYFNIYSVLFNKSDAFLCVVVQLVRLIYSMACHAGGRGFESRPLRQHYLFINASSYLFVSKPQNLKTSKPQKSQNLKINLNPYIYSYNLSTPLYFI